MHVALVVFDALAALAAERTAAGFPPIGSTRLEIEQRTGLIGDEVLNALRVLRRRALLQVDGQERGRSRYSLVPGAARPFDKRGHYARGASHRALQRAHTLAAHGLACVVPLRYSPAKPPSHAAQPSRVRAGHRCTLADIWRKR